MSRKANLQNLIAKHNRRLQILKEKQADYGMSVDPQVLIEIERIEAEIGKLITEAESLDDALIAEEPEKRAVSRNISKSRGIDWKWIVGFLIAVLSCIGTWFAVPGISSHFRNKDILEATVPFIPTEIKVTDVVLLTPDAPSAKTPTPTPKLSSSTPVSLSTATIPIVAQNSDPAEKPTIITVCNKDKTTGEIVPDATVEISVKEAEDFKVRIDENGCQELTFYSVIIGEAGLLAVNADGYQTYEEIIDIIDGLIIQVELKRILLEDSQTRTVTPIPVTSEFTQIQTVTPIPPTPSLSTPTPAPSTETPTVTALADAPCLLDVTSLADHKDLSWAWIRDLESDEFFYIQIYRKDPPETIDAAWLQIPFYTFNHPNGAGNEYYWEIAVVRGEPERLKDWSIPSNLLFPVWEPPPENTFEIISETYNSEIDFPFFCRPPR